MLKLLNKLDVRVISGGWYSCINKERNILEHHKPFRGIFGGLNNKAAKHSCCDLANGFKFYQNHGELCPAKVEHQEEHVPLEEAGCIKPRPTKISSQEVHALTVAVASLSGNDQ